MRTADDTLFPDICSICRAVTWKRHFEVTRNCSQLGRHSTVSKPIRKSFYIREWRDWKRQAMNRSIHFGIMIKCKTKRTTMYRRRYEKCTTVFEERGGFWEGITPSNGIMRNTAHCFQPWRYENTEKRRKDNFTIPIPPSTPTLDISCLQHWL